MFEVTELLNHLSQIPFSFKVLLENGKQQKPSTLTI